MIRSEVPREFGLRAYFGDAWAVYRGGGSYEVEVRFVPEAASLVTETTWHHTKEVRRDEDGSVTLVFRVDGLEEIVWWVLVGPAGPRSSGRRDYELWSWSACGWGWPSTRRARRRRADGSG